MRINNVSSPELQYTHDPASISLFTFLKIFSEIARPISAKFLWVGGTKICSWHLGVMTKMATMPIYRKSLQKSPPEPVDRFS